MTSYGYYIMTQEKHEEKHITIKVLRAQMELIERILKTKNGGKFTNPTDVIKQAINEKLEHYENN